MKCGDCTLCCKLCEIEEVDSLANEWCKYCDPKGCMIYEVRPESCRIFKCVWRQMENAHVDLRPDISKVMWEKVFDDVLCGHVHPDYEINKLVQRQISAFLKEGLSVVVKRKKTRPVIFKAESANANDIWQRLEERLQ